MKSAPSKMRVFGILIVGGFLVYFAVKFFTSKAPIVDQSVVSVRSPPRMESVPGSVKDNLRYKELQEKENEKRAEEARKKGTSALPTLVNRLKDEKTDEQFFQEASAPTPEPVVEKNSREEALRRAQEEADKRLKAQQERLDRLRQEQDNRRQAAAAARQNERDQKEHQKMVQDLSGVILADMNNLVANLRNPPRQVYVEGEYELTAGQGDQNAKQDTPPLYKAGSIIYGVIISNYNSDSPGTVRARIVNGPLAGSTLLGQVTTPANEFTQYAPVSFTKLSRPSAQRSQPISLVAIDPQNQLPGVAAQVNYHYGQRYGAMVLSGLLNQVSQQLQDSSNTNGQTSTVEGGTAQGGTNNTTSGSDNGTNVSGSDLTTPVLNDIMGSLDTISGRPITYTIAQGTPVGLLFENDFVLEF